MIPINTSISKNVAGETFYLAEIPPTRGVKKLWVSWKMVDKRAPFLPDFGEIASFQISPVSEKLEYYIHYRRNYKIVIYPFEDIKELLPAFVKELGCDSITHLIISTKIYNSIIFSEDTQKIYIVGRRPKDLIHKTVILLLGDAKCEYSPEQYKEALDNHISFVIDTPKVYFGGLDGFEGKVPDIKELQNADVFVAEVLESPFKTVAYVHIKGKGVDKEIYCEGDFKECVKNFLKQLRYEKVGFDKRLSTNDYMVFLCLPPKK